MPYLRSRCLSSYITHSQTKWFREPLPTSAKKISESEGLSARLSDVETAPLMRSQADRVSFLPGCLFLFTQHLAECLACGMLLSRLVAEWTHTYLHSRRRRKKEGVGEVGLGWGRKPSAISWYLGCNRGRRCSAPSVLI